MGSVHQKSGPVGPKVMSPKDWAELRRQIKRVRRLNWAAASEAFKKAQRKGKDDHGSVVAMQRAAARVRLLADCLSSYVDRLEALDAAKPKARTPKARKQ